MHRLTILVLVGLTCTGVSYGTFHKLSFHPKTPVSFYGVAQSKKIDHFTFRYAGWSYHVQPETAERLRISGVNSDAYPDLEALFRRQTDRQHADLLIFACSHDFGKQECDSYGPPNERGHVGPEITPAEVEHYKKIIEVGGSILKGLSHQPPQP
jgi:hypothetical protein